MKPTLIVRAAEAMELVDALQRLAKICTALGYLEDERSYIAMATSLKLRVLADTECRSYEQRVQSYEAQGMTRSDAQAAVDAEDMHRPECRGGNCDCLQTYKPRGDTNE